MNLVTRCERFRFDPRDVTGAFPHLRLSWPPPLNDVLTSL